MSFQRVQQVRVAIPREAVWGALMTPDVWPVMDDAVQRCTPVAEDGTVLADVAAGEAGDLAVGQRIMVVPRAVARGTVHALTAPPARIVEVVEGFRFAWQQDQPGGFTRATWSLIDSADGRGTVVERRIEAEGPLGCDRWWDGRLGYPACSHIIGSGSPCGGLESSAQHGCFGSASSMGWREPGGVDGVVR
mgnify:CR=1 FL=1